MKIPSGLSSRRGPGCALLLATCLLLSGPATAQLAGLVFDPDEALVLVAAIDSESGDATPGSASVADCCLMLPHLTAADTDGERFFAYGQFTGGNNDGETHLFTLGFDGNSAGSVSATVVPEILLAYDALNDRLVSLRSVTPPPPTRGGGGLNMDLQVIAVDIATGAVSDIGTPNTGCCEIVSGVAAVDSAGQRLFFAGRQSSAGDWRLFSTDLVTGVVNDIVTLPAGQPGFMAFNEGSGQVDILMQQDVASGSQIISADPSSGGLLVQAGHASPDCCLLALGQTPSLSLDGEFWWLSGSASTLAPGLAAMSSFGTNGLASTQPLTDNFRLIAVVVNGQTVSLDLLFQDRFEL